MSKSLDKCPKCGGRRIPVTSDMDGCDCTGGMQCIRRQLAAMTAERDAANKRAETAEGAYAELARRITGEADGNTHQAVMNTARELVEHYDWPRCETCQCELQDGGDGVGMTCPLCSSHEAKEKAEAALAVMTRQVQEWNAAVEKVIGRRPQTGIDIPTRATALLDRLARAEAVVAKYCTADGVPATDMMRVWKRYSDGEIEDGTVALCRVNYEGGWDGIEHWYSNRAAAEATRSKP